MKKKNNNKAPKNPAQVLSLFSLDEDEDENKDPTTGEPAAFAHVPPAPLEPIARPRTHAPGNEPDLTDGRDELNLAEFPLTLLSERAPEGVESLTFSDVVYDSGDGGRPVTRTLTVTPAAGVGLPTPADGDVLLSLVQLTRWKNGFADRSVTFSRYEIVKLLRWPDSGPSYARIETALNRWMGVTLFFNRAWWDKRQKCWVNEKFHVLDRVSLRTKREGLSAFTWGEVPFNSFRAENVKRIDLNQYFDLQLPSSRRLYRFLDKRFHHRDGLSFDLRTLACEHVGFSRDYTNPELKRRFTPAVEELEGAEYIEAANPDERFVSPRHGEWRAFFRRKDTPAPGPAADAELVTLLVGRGVTDAAAAALVREFPADLVRARVGVLDWLIDQKDRRVERNPAGFLVASIRSNYQPPPDYRPAPKPVAPVPVPAAAPGAAAPVGAPRTEEPPPPSLSPVAAYLAARTADERAGIEAAALAADPDRAAMVRRATSDRFRLAAVEQAVTAYVTRLLANPPAAVPTVPLVPAGGP